MGRLAKVSSGQCQPGLKAFKKGGLFEKSGKDVEPKGMKEGSKKEEKFDLKQQKTAGKGIVKKSGNDLDMYVGAKKEGLKCGGKVKK